jgi:hypothetical protein
MATQCFNCDITRQVELEVGISDTYSRLSVNADTYKCHRCKKRSWCKDRRPEKAIEADWEKRKECGRYEEDEEWWT